MSGEVTQEQLDFIKEGERYWARYQSGKMTATQYAKNMSKLGERRIKGMPPELIVGNVSLGDERD
jgi:hypothetical protein